MIDLRADSYSNEAIAGRSILKDYGLAAGDNVELELLVESGAGVSGPRLVEGAVVSATTLIVAIEHPSSHRLTRVPWAAIATIRNAVTAHPAL